MGRAYSRALVHAVQHVRRMRGGAQGHLMRADDGNYYVVKFQNNPQHVRVLANELLATRLAERIGLPVALPEVVEVDKWLIEHTLELRVELAGQSIQCTAGLQFGSRYLVDPLAGQVFDYVPDVLLERVKNLETFTGILAFDKWTCNANGRQAAFWRKSRERRYSAAFIDQGYCFNAGEWTFPDSPLRGVYMRNAVYAGVTGWSSFEPWLERIEEFEEKTLWQCAEGIPHEWYGDWDALERLCEMLLTRRSRVRELIESFRDSSRQPFPNWTGSHQPSAVRKGRWSNERFPRAEGLGKIPRADTGRVPSNTEFPETGAIPADEPITAVSPVHS